MSWGRGWAGEAGGPGPGWTWSAQVEDPQGLRVCSFY